ncbi:MAG: UvrD-helicase domain-containing protein [Caldilineaceae bacterium]|nr:UvrD-helicase domain-containing protein [Caldilineaceae bacterium]
MPKLVADLHIHSHFSRATSRDLDLENLSKWAQLKGVHVVGTGDIAHPGWLAEMKAKLTPAEDGLFRLNDEVEAGVAAQVPPACRAPVRFLLAGEVSNIYKRDGQVRKIHHLLFMPSLAAVERLQAALEKIGNIRADGRPILGLDSRDLLEIVLETDPQAHLIPAHIWTPWFAILGSKSGFDSIEACFGDLTPHIFALETGLSSDPPMNWRVSSLDRYTLISNSDAHSPPKLAREATLFTTELAYAALFDALRSGDPTRFGGTIEFFPEEGKYHADGHRACGVRWAPDETAAHGGLCPVCGKPVTVGVLNRIAELADRPPGAQAARVHPHYNLIPLPEILGEVYGVGAGAKQVQQAYSALLARLGPELAILQETPLDEIASAGGALLAEGVRRMRSGEVTIAAGYDGEYGVIKLFDAHERTVAQNQIGLFDTPPRRPAARRRQTNREEQGDAVRPMSLYDGHTETAPPTELREQPASVSPHAPAPLLDGLNAEQQAAARCIDRRLLIVAGPGTGKTRTLTHRIAYLLVDHAVAPEAILAITFTNKAAEEMAERLAALVGSGVATRLTIQTFHAFGAQLLRSEGHLVGLPGDFAIAGDEERVSLMRRLYPAWSERARNQALERIAAAKEQLCAPDEAAGAVANDVDLTLADVYGAYDAELRRCQMVDFDDLMMLSVRLLEQQPALLGRLHERYRWISVDEYQDINLAQYRLVRLLTTSETGAPPNLCAIGDPDQAIYGFRGADRRYFLHFVEDYPDAQLLRLRQNYRSTQSILDAARQVIDQNADAERLRIWSEFLQQTRLEIYPAPTDKAEAEYVVHEIEQAVGGVSLFSFDSGRVDERSAHGAAFGDFAVLYRTNAQSRALVEAFDRSGIPYQTVGQTPLVDYKEIRELLAYLHVAHNPQDAHHRALVMDAAPKQAADQVTAFLRELHDVQGALPVTELIDRVDAFVAGRLREPRSDAASDRVAQLRRRALPYGAQLGDFLDALALLRETDYYDARADRITLMTLHAAKGLEFPVVFIVGCEETLIPYVRPGADASEGSIDVEEERRLFYVGMTRARRRLILTHARVRFLFGQQMQNPPSRFLHNIEETLKEVRELTQRKAAQKEQPPMQQLALFAQGSR